MQLRRVLILCCFAGCVQIVVAQNDTTRCWTLDDCIAYALEHNIDIKLQEVTAGEKAVTLSESKWAYAPNVSASSGYNLSTGRVLDPTTYNFIENQTVQGFNSSVSANTTIFGGLKNMYTLKRAKLDLHASVLGVEKMRNDVALNVTAYFLEVLGAQEAIRNAVQIVETLKVQEEKTAKLVEVRKVTMADLLQIQSQLADAENTLFSVRNTYDIARLNLCQLLEIDDYVSFQTVAPEDTDIASISLPMDVAAVEDAAQDLPQMGMSRLGIDIAKRDLQIARSAYYPTISLGVGYGTSYSDARQKTFQNSDGTYRYEAYPFFEQYKDNASSYISVSLNIPIFNRLSARKNVQRQKYALKRAEYTLRVAEKQLSKEVNQAYIDAATAREKYFSSQKFVASASEAARQVERKYNLGAATVVDYNTALNNLVKAQTQLVQSKYEYIFKMKIIDFYAGK